MNMATAALRLSSFLENPGESRVDRFNSVRTVQLWRSTCDVHIDHFWCSRIPNIPRRSACAELGRFEEAVEHAEKSLESVPPLRRRDFEAPLAAYRAGRPYRDRGSPSQE